MKIIKDTDSQIEKIFIYYLIFALVVMTGAVDFVFDFGPGAGSTKRLFSLLLLYLVSLAFLILLPSKRAFDIAFNPLILLVIFLPLVSISWSLDTGLSARRGFAHALTLVLILAGASRLTLEEFFRLFMVMIAVTGVITIFVIGGMPGTGITQGGPNDGSWRGGFGHKAIMGRISAMAIAVSLFFPAKEREMKYIKWFNVTVFFIIIAMTQSRIAWGTLGGSLVAAMIFKVMVWQRLDGSLRAIIFLFLATIAVIGAMVAFEYIIHASGRDMTFSGRTSLWQAAINVGLTQHPMVGAGYGAFWTEITGQEVFRYLPHWGKIVSHAHNGYVDAWLQMGVLGLGTLVGVTLVSIFYIFRNLNDPQFGTYWFLLLILNIQFLSINLGGTISFLHSEIFWIMFLLPLYFRHQYRSSRPQWAATGLYSGARVPRPDAYYPSHVRFPRARN